MFVTDRINYPGLPLFIWLAKALWNVILLEATIVILRCTGQLHVEDSKSVYRVWCIIDSAFKCVCFPFT